MKKAYFLLKNRHKGFLCRGRERERERRNEQKKIMNLYYNPEKIDDKVHPIYFNVCVSGYLSLLKKTEFCIFLEIRKRRILIGAKCAK